MTNDIRAKMREALNNLWSRVLSLFDGLDQRVTDLEEGGGGGGGGGDVNVIEAISFNGANVPPDASKRVSMSETDPTVPAWAKAARKPSYTASEVGAIAQLSINSDITQPDNGLPDGTASRTNYLYVKDNNNKVISIVQTTVKKNGDISISIGPNNYVNGSLRSSFVTITQDKSGNTTYAVNSADSFRSAINAAASSDIPTKTSDLTNDSGFITSETDPTVPAWAKAATKPTYTAAEVGALPANTPIPSATSDLTNDSDFISGTVVNNATTATAGTVLDGRMGKTLLDTLNERISNYIPPTNYSTLAEAAAAVFDDMGNNTVKIGRIARSNAYAYFAMRNSANYASMLAFTYNTNKFYFISKAAGVITVNSLTGTAE